MYVYEILATYNILLYYAVISQASDTAKATYTKEGIQMRIHVCANSMSMDTYECSCMCAFSCLGGNDYAHESCGSKIHISEPLWYNLRMYTSSKTKRNERDNCRMWSIFKSEIIHD